MFLWAYHISTGAGHGVEPMMQALYDKKICSYTFEQSVSTKSHNVESFQNRFINTWSSQLSEIFETHVDLTSKTNTPQARWGVILATTKGSIEDSIWELAKQNQPKYSVDLLKDPGETLLNNFLDKIKLNANTPQLSITRTSVISQACSSTHIAFEVAQHWLDWNWVDFILVLSGDLIGPFVSKGFASLKLISQQGQKPFDQTRDGLFLGDAVGCAIVSTQQPKGESIRFRSFANHNEGAVTKPSLNGDSLYQALQKLSHINQKPKPDFILAHGTGTRFNDTAEDRALARYFKENRLNEVPITGAKWCLGHTLGASGLVDIIAASEVLKRQKLFPIATSTTKDPHFLYQNYYLNDPSSSLNEIANKAIPFNQAIVTSLGFGGVHAAGWLERVSI